VPWVWAFFELEEGLVDFCALRDVLKEINHTGWAIVEQDMYPVSFDKPLPIANRNRRYGASSEWDEGRNVEATPFFMANRSSLTAAPLR
jgi:hypothetical protein